MTSYWRSIVTMALSGVVWDIQCLKMSWPWNQGQRSLNVIKRGTIRQNKYGFLLVFFSNFVPETHRFWDIRLVNIQWPWNPGWGLLKVVENYTIQWSTHNFLLTFHSNYRPISHRFRDKRQFLSKIANFSHPRVFNAPAEWGSLGIRYRRRGNKKLEWWSYQVVENVLRYV